MAGNQNALLSVYNKDGIVDFAQGLAELDFNIYASGGTGRTIAEAGLPITDVAELVGGSAILGHRVVTLSREVHAGLLADISDPEQVAELERLGIPILDLVAVDMYPLAEEIAKPGGTEADVIDKTDIGGPTMLRAGAKGRRIVLSRVEQRPEVIEWLKAGRPDDEEFRRYLAAIAELEVADYVLQSALYLGDSAVHGFIGEHKQPVRYGENAWQKSPGLYAEKGDKDPLALYRFELLQGAEPSFNNYADMDRMLQTITHIAAAMHRNYHESPAIAIGVKHGNACGVAETANQGQAIIGMLEGDQRAIFGGSVMLNFDLDKELAELLMTHGMNNGKRLLDVVVAPRVTKEALEVLERREGKLRVMVNPALGSINDALDTKIRDRFVRGGRLVQANYDYVPSYLDRELHEHVPGSLGIEIEWKDRDMLMAWAIGSTSNSNTITLVKDGMLIGNGVGQQDRVSAAELAVKRARDAGHDTQGAVAYSDSFFPFPDGPMKLAEAGIEAILATRGSIKDDEVAKALYDAGVILYTLPDTTARGFYGH